MDDHSRYILVVDSDWDERFTLSMLLQRFGYTVASTNDAREGIEFLCVAPAVAVIAEAGRGGTDLLIRLKADKRFRDVPIILTCASRDQGLEEDVRKGHIAGILRTPLDPNDVFVVMQKVIEHGTRTNIRISTALPAMVRRGAAVTEGFVTVLSRFGMFFRTLDPLPAREHVLVEFSLWDRPLTVEAEVLYTVSFDEGPFNEPGLGLKFINVEAQHMALIALFINEEIGMGTASSSGPDEGAITGKA